MQRIDIKRGLNIAPDSAFTPAVGTTAVRSVALLGVDYPGIKPTLAVKQGDHVNLGDVVFTDHTEQIRCCAPATGIVSAIHLGARRSLQALVIEVTEEADEYSVALPVNSAMDASTVRNVLLHNGLWPAFRVRPFDVIPAADAAVGHLFITAIDTHPSALNPASVIERNAKAFAAGVEKLSLLAGHTYVCRAPGDEPSHADMPAVTAVAFSGPHPAGLAGTHIHYLAPNAKDVWYIGYQDVIAVGHLFLHGRITFGRDISLAGPGLNQPQQLRTRSGAALVDLIGDAEPGSAATSGSPLHDQRDGLVGSYLGRLHNQVWVSPPVTQASVKTETVKSWLQQFVTPRTAISAQHPGEVAMTGMLSVEAFDAVWPFSMPPLPLLRALLTGDTDTANELGAMMLAEEDLALCAYVCPAKQDYGAALRATLQAFEKDG